MTFKKGTTFTFKIKSEDKENIAIVSAKLGMSGAEAIRFLVRFAAVQFTKENAPVCPFQNMRILTK